MDTRYGILSDIHGNLPAVNAVLDKFDSFGVTKIVCAGDIVGVGGFPEQTIDAVKSESDVCVKGNHDVIPFRSPRNDVEMLEKKLFTDAVSSANQQWIKELDPMYIEDKLQVAHCGISASNALGYEVGQSGIRPKDFVRVASQVDVPLLILGHTHEQHVIEDKFGHNTVVVNPGVVGDVYTNTAQYAIVDTDSTGNVTHVELHTTEYDQSKLYERIRDIEDEYEFNYGL